MWNKLDDVRPSDGEVVIAYSPKDGINYETYFTFNSFGVPIWQRSGRCNMEGVTHWMSKLTPPKSNTAEAVEQPPTQQGSTLPQISAFVEWVASLSKIEYAAHEQLIAVINAAQKLLPC